MVTKDEQTSQSVLYSHFPNKKVLTTNFVLHISHRAVCALAGAGAADHQCNGSEYRQICHPSSLSS